MRFTAAGPLLAEAARFVNTIVPGKPHEYELGGMLIESFQTAVRFGAYDYELAGMSSLPVMEGEPGKVLVSARLFTDVLASAAKRGDVTVHDAPGDYLGRPGWLVVIAKGAEWRLPLLGVDLYPELPQVDPPIGMFSSASLAAALKRILPAAGSPGEPPMMGGVCIATASDESMTIATTDKYRVAVTTIPWSSEPGGDGPHTLPDTLIPSEVLSTALTVARRAAPTTQDASEVEVDATVRLSLGGHGVALIGRHHMVSGRVLASQRPGGESTWRRVAYAIAEPAVTVMLDTAELRQAVRDVSLMLDPAEAIILEVRDDGQVTLSPTVEGKGRVQIDMTLEHFETTGVLTSYEAYVESRYLLDVLGSVSSPQVMFSFLARPFAPFRVNPVLPDGTPDQTYWQVIAQKKGAAAASV